jgi:hypothetical protein
VIPALFQHPNLGVSISKTQYSNGKMIPVETVPGVGWGGEGGRIKENDGGGKFKYNIFDVL